MKISHRHLLRMLYLQTMLPSSMSDGPLKDGIAITLPSRDREGRHIMLLRAAKWNYSAYSAFEVHKSFVMNWELMLEVMFSWWTWHSTLLVNPGSKGTNLKITHRKMVTKVRHKEFALRRTWFPSTQLLDPLRCEPDWSCHAWGEQSICYSNPSGSRPSFTILRRCSVLDLHSLLFTSNLFFIFFGNKNADFRFVETENSPSRQHTNYCLPQVSSYTIFVHKREVLSKEHDRSPASHKIGWNTSLLFKQINWCISGWGCNCEWIHMDLWLGRDFHGDDGSHGNKGS